MNTYGYISKEYYDTHKDLVKILDINDETKHDVRTHICLEIDLNNIIALIPLRRKLGNPIRKFGKIGFPVPCEKRPNAGLDYRYIMIFDKNNVGFIRYDEPKIPKSQQKIINENYNIIKEEAMEYINSYIKLAKKDRAKYKPLFKESSLVNFHKELGIVIESKKEKQDLDTQEAAATSEQQNQNPESDRTVKE